MIRSYKTRALVALAGSAALILSACGTTSDDDADASGDDCSVALAYIGPLTGEAANLGINIVEGAKFALEEYNADDPDCQVELKEFDSQGDPEKATPLASQIIKDNDIVGVVGPTFSGETNATGAAFAEAGLVTVSPSATSPELSTNGWDTFHRIVGSDISQAEATQRFIAETLGAKSVMVVDDSSDYGEPLAKGISDALGDLVTQTDKIKVGDRNFSPVVTRATASNVDAVYFAGYYKEGGLLAKQLRQGGYEGAFISGDGSLDKGFIDNAGAAAAEGAYLTCGCLIASGEFAEAFEASSGQAPGTYSTEGYDAINVLLHGIADGKTDRESLLDWVNNYDEEGVTKQIKFGENGDIPGVAVYSYKVEGGVIQPGEMIE